MTRPAGGDDRELGTSRRPGRSGGEDQRAGDGRGKHGRQEYAKAHASKLRAAKAESCRRAVGRGRYRPEAVRCTRPPARLVPRVRVRNLATAFLAVGAAATLAAAPALAANSLTLSTSAAPSFSLTITGADQSPTYTVPVTVTDSRSNSPTPGWNLTITSTTLSTGAPVHSLSTTASRVTAVAQACPGGGCVNPTNSVAVPVTVPAGAAPPTAVKFYNAAFNTGFGTFTITPTITVSVPGNAYSGAYSSTLTIAVVSGP
jgi:hypothetical protein